MNDELTARHRAITLRLAGRPVQAICAAVGRSKVWFHKWWHRYLEAGPEGLYDLTRANHHVAQRISPELERAILSIRRRLQAHASPATRYSLIGATAILAELKALGIRPLPCERTIERVLERNGLTAPRVRLAPLLPRQEYPGPQARASNELHEVDLVGPIYLQGSGHRYYIWVGKDAFDGAVCLRLAGSRRMDEVLWFLGECWKDLGRPEQVQLDNARELSGWGPAARTLSRVIRLCLRFGVSRCSSQQGSRSSTAAWRISTAGSRSRCSNGGSGGRATCAGSWRGCRRRSIRNTSTRGWGARRRRSTAGACGCRSCRRASWCRRGGCRWPTGRVTFIRRVSVAGTVTILSQTFRVGKRHRGLYLRLVVDTGRGRLTAYLNGRVLKRWPYKLLND